MAFLSGYTSRWEYKVLATKVPSTQTDFPVYVDLSAMPASFWSTVADGGGDIRVTRSDGTTECAREVVSCATATDTGELHFLANSVDGTTDTVFYIYANGTSADYAVSDTYGRNAVWGSSFKAVYHMNDTTTSTVTDSTSNTNNGIKSGANSPQEINGIIGKAQEFNASANAGDGEEIDLGTGVYTIGTGDFTFHVRIKLNSLKDTQGIIYNKRSVGGDNRTLLWPRLDGSDLKFQHWATDTSNATFFHPTVLATDTWYSVYMTRTGSSGALIVNGSKQTGATRPGDLGGATTWHIGNALSAAAWFPLDGILDEVRVLNTVVSDGYATTEYNNQSDHSTWATIGAEETDGGGGGAAFNNFKGFGGL